MSERRCEDTKARIFVFFFWKMGDITNPISDTNDVSSIEFSIFMIAFVLTAKKV